MTDLRHALRALRAAPGFTVAAVLVLALGIGATAAMFGVVDGVLLRPLPFEKPEQLVVVTSRGEREGPGFPPSVADFEDWRRDARGLQGMALARGEALLLRGADGATSVTTAHVSDGWFRVLGLRPLLGRTFVAEEEGPAARRALVLSHALWMSQFGGDRGVVGRTLDLAEGPYVVVGVLPAAVSFPAWAQAYAPLATIPARREALTNRGARVDNVVVARLGPGMTPAAGQAAIDAVARALAEQAPENEGWSAQVQPLRQAIVAGNERPLWVLLGAVVAVLLIACANVANLQFVRASSRRQELAVRAALGAPRWRIARQLLVESALLSAVGAAAGLVLAAWLVSLVRQAAAQSLPRVPEIAIDARVAAFAIAVAAMTALLAGLVPAFAASRQAMAPALREGSKGTGKGGRRAMRSALVAVEIALALVLLVGAGVLLRSFARLRAVDPGFDAEHVLAVRIEPPKARYDTPEQLQALYDRLSARLARVPGVRAVGFVNHMPLGAGVMSTRLEGGEPVNPAGASAVYRTPDAGYVDAMGVKVLRGRALGPDDMRPSSTVVVVNETLARQRWGTLDVVGKTVTYRKQAQGRPDYDTPVTATVVGVVGDMVLSTLGRPAAPEIWVPSAANTWRWGHFAVRTAGEPAALATAVRRALGAEDRDISIASVRPALEMASSGIADRQFRTALLGAFAGAALLLAALGVYGVMAYAVTQRIHEFGVRAALGATPGQVWRLVVGSGLRIAAAGVGAGLLLALVATRSLEGMVYGVTVRDGVSFAAGSVVLALVALAACWLPARRAMKMDPAKVLRAE
jgi:predicted permease